MKTQIISGVSGFLFSIVLVSSSFAQSTFKPLPVVAEAGNAKVIEKIQNAFNSQFANAENARWYEVDKNFLVEFFKDDQEQRALFTKKGYLIYHISYGSEKHLPPKVRTLVKSTYFDYNITRVIKVNEDKRLVWFVNLEDNKSFFLVKVEDGEMEEAKRYQKTL